MAPSDQYNIRRENGSTSTVGEKNIIATLREIPSEEEVRLSFWKWSNETGNFRMVDTGIWNHPFVPTGDHILPVPINGGIWKTVSQWLEHFLNA